MTDTRPAWLRYWRRLWRERLVSVPFPSPAWVAWWESDALTASSEQRAVVEEADVF